MKRMFVPLRDQRGFTLIELLVTTAMTLIVFTSLFGAMIAQQQSYTAQLDASQATQSARAAISIIKSELRKAGFGVDGQGLLNTPVNTNIYAFPVGTCNNTANRFQCNNLETVGDTTGVSDRLRIVSMESSRVVSNTELVAGALSTHSTTRYSASEAVRIPDGLALISGECGIGSASGDKFSGFKEITNDTPNSNYHHVYTIVDPTDFVEIDGFDLATECGDWNANFTVSQARVVDFYIRRTNATGESSLVMHINPQTSADREQVVAFNIDSLQVRYGIDYGTDTTDPTPDQQADVYCNDLSDVTSCDVDIGAVSAITNDAAVFASRVVAVQLGIIPRAGTRIPETANFAAFDVSLPPTDAVAAAGRGYDGALRRWVFRGSVRLRNNEIE